VTRWILLAAALTGCSLTSYPPLPPPDGPGDCSSARANLERLGGCGRDVEGYEARCRDAQAAEAEIGLRHPVACMTAAVSCEELKACR